MLERFEQVESRIDNLSSKMDEEGQSSRDDVIRKVVNQELEKPIRKDSMTNLLLPTDEVKKLDTKVSKMSAVSQLVLKPNNSRKWLL